MNGALPPSSRPTLLDVPAACAISRLADLGRAGEADEVAHLRMLAVSTPPMATGSPVMTLNTPGGKPARCASSASASAVSGVSGPA
jgi:hypothetical protein